MFEIIVKDHDLFILLLKKLVFSCAADITYRESKDKIDTFLLREAIQIREKRFEPVFFRKMYETVLRKFIETFEPLDFEKLPFADERERLDMFQKLLWETYFICEFEATIKVGRTH